MIAAFIVGVIVGAFMIILLSIAMIDEENKRRR